VRLGFPFILLLGGEFHVSVADQASVAGASNRAADQSYQMSQYANAPDRNDPYSPGQRSLRDADAMLSNLEAALSILQKGSHRSKLW
jgi:hypothetical protein